MANRRDDVHKLHSLAQSRFQTCDLPMLYISNILRIGNSGEIISIYMQSSDSIYLMKFRVISDCYCAFNSPKNNEVCHSLIQ